MNRNIKAKSIRLLILLCLLYCIPAQGQERMRIVATLSGFADIAKSVGGDLVEVTSVASPKFNPHFIEPKPSDVLRVKRADLYLHSGLDLEAWSGPLVDAAARPEIRKGGNRQLDLSRGISLLEVPVGQVSRSEGDIHLFGNPHYWLDPRNAAIIAGTIATKMAEQDPAHRDIYVQNLNAFLADLNSKIREWQTLLAPFHGQKLVGYHNEWIYLMKFSGLVMEQFLEPKPGIPPGPGQIENIITYIKSNSVKAIVQPTFYAEDAAQDVAAKTGAKVVLICQNVKETPDANNYIAMIDFDIKEIVGALKS